MWHPPPVFSSRAFHLLLLLPLLTGVAPVMAQAQFGPLRPRGCERWLGFLRKPLEFTPARQQELEKMLQTQSIKTVAYNRGTTNSRIVVFENGERAIFKYWTGQSHNDYRAEVAVYGIAKKLGIENVPPTVLRAVDMGGGERELGSLQYWIPDSKTVLQIRRPGATDALPEKTYRRNLLELDRGLEFLDTLISNWDRNASNLVYRFTAKGPQQFGIDHAAAFIDYRKRQARVLELQPEKIWIERLRSLSAEEWSVFLTSFSLQPAQIGVFLERRREILDYWDR
ncbi:MAG: hypothetical protein EBX52_04330 [Proteobacteria bacterium]|nr:hypothetical protein [Pseudomonadota bacterium]